MSMFEKFMAVGAPLRAKVGSAVGMSADQQAFYRSGKCPHCGVMLTGLFGVAANFYGADGQAMSQWTGGAIRADSAECQKCHFRWKLYGNEVIAQASAIKILDTVETDRSEEFFGEDRRVIDNSQCATEITRNFSFTKEWSKSFNLEIQNAKTEGGQLTLGAKDAAALHLSSEDTLRRTYAVSQDMKETSSEDVGCKVAAHSKLTIVVRWKRIWQHGHVCATKDGVPVTIPFRVAVAMTFDQQQIEEDRAAAV